MSITAVYMPLFGGLDMPYVSWAKRNIMSLSRHVTGVLIVHDGTAEHLHGLPENVDCLEFDGSPCLPSYFGAACEALAACNVDAFHYASADDIFEPNVIKEMLQLVKEGYDVGTCDFLHTGQEHLPKKYNPKNRYRSAYPPRDAAALTFPETSAYSVEFFKSFPVTAADRRNFILGSIRRAWAADYPVRIGFTAKLGFAYVRHYCNLSKNFDRSIGYPMEVIE